MMLNAFFQVQDVSEKYRWLVDYWKNSFCVQHTDKTYTQADCYEAINGYGTCIVIYNRPSMEAYLIILPVYKLMNRR